MTKQQETISVKLIKSPIGRPELQKKSVRALGFRKLHQVRRLPKTAPVLGLIRKVAHLLALEES